MNKTFEANEYNTQVATLPIAEECQVFVQGKNDLGAQDHPAENYKAIRISGGKEDGRIVDIPSKHYKLVQHAEAFKPIVEGLTQAGEQSWKFSLKQRLETATLQVFTMGVNDGKSDILLGFQVRNSFDRSTTVSYGLQTQMGKSWIEIVGYRQVCSNGMTIRVPLDQAEFVKPELRREVETLLQKSFSFKHIGDVKTQIEGVQFVVEAMSLLKAPLQAMIKKAQKIGLTDIEKCEELIEKHFRSRMAKRILKRFEDDQDTEGTDLWSLYNAITYEASHDVSVRAHERLMSRAGLFFEEALATL